MDATAMEQKRKLEINRACKDGQKFSQLFYKAFDTRRHAISAFYMDRATLIWNGNGVNGKTAITQFYETLPTTSKIEVESLDAQPVLGVAVNDQPTILVNVKGGIKFQGKQDLPFTQTFLLTAQGETWKILNDTFRFQETINCLKIGPHLTSLKELHDGRHFISLLKIIRHASGKQEFVLKKWTSIVINFLEEYYEVGLSEEINFSGAKAKNEFELAKIAILILCALIQCERSQQFLKDLTKLDLSIQLTIKTIFEGVLHPECNTTLKPDFAKVLKIPDFSISGTCNTDCAAATHSAASKSVAMACAVYTNDDGNESPIKQYLQSPQVVQKLALREKALEISRLKATLETEVANREEIENDLKVERLKYQKSASEFETLKRTVSELNLLNNNLTESQHLLDLKETEIQKLQAKNKKLKEDLDEFDGLQTAFKTLTKDNQALEDRYDKLEKTFAYTRDKLKELEGVKFDESQCQLLLKAKDEDISRLKEQLLVYVNELEETRNLYREARINCDHIPQDPTPGENMAVVSGIIHLEQTIQRLQEEILTKDKHTERLVSNHCQATSELEGKLQIQTNLWKQETEESCKKLEAQEALILQLNQTIAKLECQCDSLVGEKDTLATQNSEFLSKIEGLVQDVQIKCAELSAVQDILDETEKCRDSLLADLENLKKKMETCEEHLNSRNTEIEKLESLTSELEIKLSALSEEKTSLEKIMEEMSLTNSHRIAELQNLLDDEHRSRAEIKCEADLRKAEMEELCKKLDETITTIESKCDCLVGEKEILATENSTCLSKIEGLEQDVQAKCSELSAVRDILHETEKSKNSVLANLAALQKKMKTCEEHLNTKNTDIEKLESFTSELELKLTTLLEEKISLERIIEEMSLSNSHKIIELQTLLDDERRNRAEIECKADLQKGEMEKYYKEMGERATVILQLEHMTATIESKYDSLVGEKNILANENSACLSKIECLEQEAQAKCSELSAVRLVLDETEKCRNSVLADLEALQKKMEACEERLNTRNTDIEKLESLTSELELKLIASSEEKTTLEKIMEEMSLSKSSKIAELQTKLEDERKSKAAIKSEADLRKAEMEKFCKKFCERETVFEQTIATIESKCNILAGEKDILASENSKYQSKIESLVQEVLAKSSELSAVQDILGETEKHRISLLADVENLKKEKETCEEHLNARNKDIAKLESLKSELDSKLTTLSEEKAVLEKIMEETSLSKSSQIAELQVQLDDERGSRAALELEADLRKAEIEKFCEREIVLEQTIATIESKCDILVGEKEILASENSKYQSKIESLVQNVLAKCSELSNVQDMLGETEKHRIALSADVEKLKREKETCEGHLNIRNNDIEKLKSLISELELEMRTSLEEKQKNMEEMSLLNAHKIEELQIQLDDERRCRETLEREADLQKVEMEKCCNKLDDREKSIFQLEKTIAELESNYNILMGEKEVMASENSRSQIEIKDLTQSVQTKLLELSTLQSVLDETEMCKITLLADLESLEKLKQSYEEDLTGKDSNIQRLTTVISDLETKIEVLEKDRLKRDITITELEDQAKFQAENLQNVTKKWEIDMDSRNRAVEKLEILTSELELKIVSLSAEKTACEKAIEEMNRANFTSIAELRDQLAEERENRTATELAASLQNEKIEKFLEQLNERESYVLHLEKEFATLESKCAELTCDRDALASENGNCQSRISSLVWEVQDLSTVRGLLEESEKLRTTLCTNLENLQNEKDKCGNEIKLKINEIERLSAFASNLEAKMEAMENEHVCLNKTIEELKQEIQTKGENASSLEAQAKMDCEKIHSLELLDQRQNEELEKCHDVITNKDAIIGQLERQVQFLKNQLERSNNFLTVQKEMTEQVMKMKEQVNVAEQKHLETVRMMEAKAEGISVKYEKAKSIIEEMSNEIKSKQTSLDEKANQLKGLREQYDLVNEKLTNVMAANKKGEERFALLQRNLRNEQEQSANQSQLIGKLEAHLKKQQQQMQKLNSETYLKPLDNRRPTSTFPRRPSITVTYNSAESYNLKLEDSESNLPDTVFSINAAAQDMSTHTAYNIVDNSFVQESRALPSGAGSYFPCEDEEGELLNFSYINDRNSGRFDRARQEKLTVPPGAGYQYKNEPVGEAEFSNFSYLNDLKSGRCDLPNQTERLGELQRRNTLCLPHLKSSYPVEMQTQFTDNFKDEDLKTSRLDMTGLSKVSSIHGDNQSINDQSEDALGARRKQVKPIQPTYQKPGPPTPGKSGKAAAEKMSKTPSSLKRLWRRPNPRTPKGAKGKTPPKKSKENHPEGQALHVCRNIAFSVGFSPKVKSRPKSLAMSKISPKKTSTPLRRREN